MIRECVDGLIADLCTQAGADADRRAGAHDRRQPDHAPPVPGARSHGAGRRAVRAGDRRGGAPTSARELDLAATNAGRTRLRAAVHRGSRGRRHGRRDPVRGAARPGDREPARRRRARTPRSCWATATGCSRRRARPGPAFEGAQISCGQRAAPGRDRAGAHRPRDAGAAVPRDRPGRVVATSPASTPPRSPACAVSGIIEAVAELFLAGVLTTDGVIDGALAGRIAADRARRPHVLLRAARRAGRATPGHHAERRPPDPAREGRALRRVPAADGCLRHRDRRPHPAGRGVRRAHRPGARDGAGPGARLRSRPASRAPATPPAPARGSRC